MARAVIIPLALLIPGLGLAVGVEFEMNCDLRYATPHSLA